MPSSDELKNILGTQEQKPTQIVVILDRSGSMAVIKNDTIGGFNAFLDSQKSLDAPARITLVTFSDSANTIYSNIDIQEAQHLTDKTYLPGGGTALYDTLGASIRETKAWVDSQAENDRPDKVLFVIMTDGEENTSRSVTSEELKANISSRIEAGWEFVFIGANQDSILSARTMGINKSVAFSTAKGPGGQAADVQRAYAVMDNVTMSYRTNTAMASVEGLHIDDTTASNTSN